MADLGAVDFSLIEPHKENILPLATGRSARALVTALSGTTDEHQAERQAYENELLTASDLDDPLDVWNRYVQWTLNTYPTGNSSQSQLLPLLERATRAFLHDSIYKNDPRYVKFWVLYIQKFSDAPREHFAYLARNDIGQRLALFYEEFAAWLESVGRRSQAKEVYQMGVENGARPRERLVRKFEEFIHRCEANPITEDEPRSPALPAVRPALATKTLPFGGGAEGGAAPDPQAQSSAPPPPGSKIKREKMAIFSDADNGAQPVPVLGPGTGGWDSIGTLEHRRKENIMEPTPWAGQTLKQQGGGGGMAVGAEKLAIFRDIDQPAAPPPLPSAAAPAFPNARYIYPDPSNPSLEYSFEELRAMSRKLLDIDWAARRRQEAESKQPQKQSNKISSPLPVFRDDITTTPLHTQTIAAKLDSPGAGKGKLKKRSQMMQRGEPTMTLHTRAATDEIYDILNQPIDQPNRDLDAVGEEREESNFFDDDLTTNTDAGGRIGAGSDSDSDSGGDGASQDEDGDDAGSDWSDDNKLNYEEETVGLHDDTYFQKFNANLDEDDDDDDDEDSDHAHKAPEQAEEPELPPARESMQGFSRKLFGDENHSGSAGRKKPYMTPIVERTEVSLPPTTARKRAAEKAQAAKTPSRPRGGAAQDRERRKRELEKVLSSPFMNVVPGQDGAGAGASLAGSGSGGSGDDSDFVLPPPRKLGFNTRSPPQPKTASPEGGRGENGDKENALGAAGIMKAPLGGTKKPLASAAPKADISHKGGPIITDTQLNPMTPEIHALILSKLTTPLTAYEGYYEYPPSTKSKAGEIRKSLKPPSAKSSSDKSVEVMFLGKPAGKGRPAQGQTKYIFTKQIGEGAFAPVYLVENTDVSSSASSPKHTVDADDDIDSPFKDLSLSSTHHLHNRSRTEAIKIESSPPSPWEFYIMRQAHRRLGLTRPSESILSALELHHYLQDATFLVLPYHSHGTILDLVNFSSAQAPPGQAKSGVDEFLAMFLTIELLRTIEGLHSKSIIHGDLKPDNCLLRFSPLSPGEEWEYRYRRDGGGGWNKKGVILIDFGRGIDMKIFPSNVQFIADWKPDEEVDCVEIREMRPWTYQIDLHGAAGIIHTLLFGRYLDIVGEKGVGGGLGGGKRWRVKEGFKRYWQGQIWERCFDVLLNSGRWVGEEEGTRLPVVKALRGVREEMEVWLEGNSEKGVGLRNVLRKVEGGLGRGRK